MEYSSERRSSDVIMMVVGGLHDRIGRERWEVV